MTSMRGGGVDEIDCRRPTDLCKPPLITIFAIRMQGDLEGKGWKVPIVPYEVRSRVQFLKSTKFSIISTLKYFEIKIKAELLMFKQLSKMHCYPHFPSFTPIKPRSG